MKSSDVILQPSITEKGTKLVEHENQYTFWVSPDANKFQIKRAVHDLFGVTVKKITVSMTRPISKRSMVNRKMSFQTMKRKKAFVTLGEKESITLFEGSK